MKKILLILILFCSTAFGASTTWSNGNSTGIWNDAGNWTGAAIPGAADDVTFDNTSDDDCNLDAPPTNAIIQSLTVAVTYNGTLSLAGQTIDIDGGACSITGNAGTIADPSGGAEIQCEGSFTISGAPLPATLTVTLDGAGNLASDVSSNAADLIIDASGTITPASGDHYWGGYTYTGGVCDWFANGPTTHVTSGGSGNVNWNSPEASWIKFLELDAGATMTLTGPVETRNITGAAGTTIDESGGSQQLRLVNPETLSWLFAGSFEATTLVLNSGGSDNLGNLTVDLGNGDIQLEQGTWTATAEIKIGTGNLNLLGSFGNGSFDFVAQNLTCNDVMLGSTNGNDVTVSYGSGTHIIRGDIKAITSVGNTGTLVCNMDTAIVALTGTFDGASQGSSSVLTIAGEATGGGHAEIHGGTVQNVSMPLDDDALDCTDEVLDGGSNTNCWFSGIKGAHWILGGGMTGSGEAASVFGRGIFTAANGYVDLTTTAKVSQGDSATADNASVGAKIEIVGDVSAQWSVNDVVQSGTGSWHRVTGVNYVNPNTEIDVTPAAGATAWDGETVEPFKGQLQLLSEDAFAICMWWLPRIASSGTERYMSTELATNDSFFVRRNNASGAYEYLWSGTGSISRVHTGHTDGLRHNLVAVLDGTTFYSWVDTIDPINDPYSVLDGTQPDFIRLGVVAVDGSLGAADTFGPFCLMDLSSAGTVDQTMREGIRDAWHDADMNFETFATSLIALLTGGETIEIFYWKLIEIRPGAASTANNIIRRYSRTITATVSGTESLDAIDGDTTNCTGTWLP